MTAANIKDIIQLMEKEYGEVTTYRHDVSDEEMNESFTSVNAKPMSKAGYRDITFCNLQGDAAMKAIMQSDATYIICDKALNNEPGFMDWRDQKKMLIFVERPRLWFLRMLRHFNMTFEAGDGRFVGPSSNIHKTVTMNGTVIIMDGCVIDPYVTLGLDGFGFERNEYGEFEKFPHLGGVTIGYKCEIGAHTAVDRATLPNEFTEIGRKCKIDNFVHVAHNVEVGDDTLIVSHCNLGGSVKIGKQCWLGMSATVLNGVRIGNRCIIGNRANIRKDVPDNAVVIGDDQIIGNVDEKENWKRMVGPIIT